MRMRRDPDARRSRTSRASPSGGTLLVVHDECDLRDAAQRRPQALRGHVLAFDTDVHIALQARGLAHSTPWHYVGRDERHRAERLEAQAWLHWIRHARLELDGVNLLHVAAFRHVSWIARWSWAAYALDRALESTCPRKVFAFAEPPFHGLDQPAAYRRMPALSGLLRGLAEARGLPCELIPRSPESAFVDQIAGGAAAADDRPTRPFDACARPYVLIYGNGVELLRQAPLARALEATAGLAALLVYKRADASTLAEVRRAGLNAVPESSLGACATPRLSERAARLARRRFDEAGEKLRGNLRSLFANPHVAPHLDFLFGAYARQIAGRVARWTELLSQHRPVAIVANYQTPLLDVADRLGVPSLILPHGLMTIGQPKQFTTLPPGSRIGAISRVHARRLVQAGVSRRRISLTGDPWCAELLQRAERCAAPARRDVVRARLRAEFGIAPSRKLVLLCTGSYGMPASTVHLPQTDWRDAVEQADALGRLAARRRDWAFIIKPHPRFDYPRLYERVNRALPPDSHVHVTSERDLLELASAADAVCVWNVITSALVEASLVNPRVLLCIPSVVWCDLREWAVAGWRRVRSTRGLERTLDRVFADTSYATALERRTRAALSAFVGVDPLAGVRRCAQWLMNQAGPLAPHRGASESIRRGSTLVARRATSDDTETPGPDALPRRRTPGSRPAPLTAR